MSASCSNCGETWERDPALEVECPSCQAPAGSACKRPSGHPASLHHDRDRKALQEVEGYEPCQEALGLNDHRAGEDRRQILMDMNEGG